jgi:hypothetical protein
MRLDAYTNSSGGAYFVSGHGSTWSLWNAIVTALWADTLIVLVSSSGVNSLFPPGCGTGHSCLGSYCCKLDVLCWKCHCTFYCKRR